MTFPRTPRIRVVLALLAVAVLAASQLTPLRAFEVPTHVWLLTNSIAALGTESPVFQEMALINAIGTYRANANENGDGNPAEGATILEGVAEEDHVGGFAEHLASFPFSIEYGLVDAVRRDEFDHAIRPLNHFWHPDHGVDNGLFWYNSALTKANSLFEKAVSTYCVNKNLSYWYLGRVAHLLQDMASPAHVHLDPHITHSKLTQAEQRELADSCEKWMAELDSFTGKPHHEETTSSDALVLPLSFPSYSVPREYDPTLVMLFYSMAMKAREYDSDDSGKTEPFLDYVPTLSVPALALKYFLTSPNYPSTRARGTQNSGRFFLFAGNTPPYDMRGGPPSLWFLEGESCPVTPADFVRPLQFQRDFEFDDYDGTRGFQKEDKFYLDANSSSFTEELRARGFHALWATPNFSLQGQCYTPGAVTLYYWFPATQQKDVPTSILDRDHRELLKYSISSVAQLLQYFWYRVHPISTLSVDLRLPGRPCYTNTQGEFHRAGAGADISIQVGLPIDSPMLALPDSTQDLPDLVGDTVELPEGVDQFRQVVAKRLIVKRNARIRCSFAFNATVVEVYPQVAFLEIFEGRSFRPDLATLYSHIFPAGNNLKVEVTRNPEAWTNPESLPDQLRFLFHSHTDYQSLGLSIDASGSSLMLAPDGTATSSRRWRASGGSGGVVKIVAPRSQIGGVVRCNGVFPAGDLDFLGDYELPSGGNGGAISIVADSIDWFSDPGLDLSVNGGDGMGDSSWVTSPFGPYPVPRPGLAGGHGGHGGNVYLALRNSEWLPTSVVSVSANGGHGRNGNRGEKGISDESVTSALNGAPGGHGGAGGRPGSFLGVEASQSGALFYPDNLSTLPGNGGSGGTGGNGATSSNRNAAGNGGNGGNGGKPGGALGVAGYGGSGGRANASYGGIDGAPGSIGKTENTLSDPPTAASLAQGFSEECPATDQDAPSLKIAIDILNPNKAVLVAPRIVNVNQWQIFQGTGLGGWSPIPVQTNIFGVLQLNITNNGAAGGRFFKLQSKP